MKKVWLFAIWVILFTLLLNVGFTLVSMADTIGNIIGVLLIVGLITISIKTKCLTKLFGSKEDED